MASYTAKVTTSGTLQEGSGSAGTRFVDKDFPYEEGLSGAVTKQTGDPNL